MRSRMIQVGWFVVAAALAAGGGLLGERLRPPGAAELPRAPKADWTVLLGGARAWLINYHWVRAQEDKQNGRYFDALQRAALICELQPNFPDVWSFHSWNMAFNISAATHTPEERWLWVSNGMRLLRDEGIPKNPKALLLYKDLGWLFYFKMGGLMDEMGMAYKQRWAAQMQRLLGAPPPGATEQVVAAFRPIARAPLDKDPSRQARQAVQPDSLDRLLRERRGAAAYAALLAAHDVKVDRSLLEAWNRYSLDDGAAVARLAPPAIQTDAEKAMSDLINDPAHAEARSELLAFVRAQLLWNEYRMDPDWMLRIMERYGPLDWRLVWPHALYWVTYGIHVCDSLQLGDINSLNTDRVVLNCLKDLTWGGRMTYEENPRSPDWPVIRAFPDWRFIEPCHQEHLRLAAAVEGRTPDQVTPEVFKAGHINYLTGAVQLLYASFRARLAQHYYDEMRRIYKLAGPEWRKPLEAFVMEGLSEEPRLMPDVAAGQLSASIEAGLANLAAGDEDAFSGCVAYARRVHDRYQRLAPERLKLPPMDDIAAGLLARLLIEPQAAGYNMPLVARAKLYEATGTYWPRLQLYVYDAVARFLPAVCKAEGLDFDKAFPPPPGIEQFRQERQRRLAPTANPVAP